ncbi:MAG: NmrA family NAD(P)-binding protein [Gammaproteobacteria bacterium]|nr:NmrA family NAD(P)-binding protein [Gammaproteobacteria bacterium]
MIVITGASGNVGVELTRLLLKQQDVSALRIAAYDVAEIKRLCGEDGPYVQFDYDDRATWPAVLADIKTLYLLFPLPSPKTAETRMKPFMDAAKQAGCKHIVFVSVGGAKDKKFVPHHPVEQHLKSLGVDYTILRPCYYMQNLCRNITTHDYDIAVYNELFIPAGDGVTALIDARDVAAFTAAVLTNPAAHKNTDYVLTGTEQKNFQEIAAVISQVSGRTIKYSNPSLPRFIYRMLRRRIPWDVVAFMCLFYSIIRFGKAEHLTDVVQKQLGREPILLKQFIEDYRVYWQPESHVALPVIPDWAGGPKRD